MLVWSNDHRDRGVIPPKIEVAPTYVKAYPCYSYLSRRLISQRYTYLRPQFVRN